MPYHSYMSHGNRFQDRTKTSTEATAGSQTGCQIVCLEGLRTAQNN